MAERADAAERAERLRQITERARADMARMGVDDAAIDRLVDTFYGRVRGHATLGPVFEARLSGRWEPHLDKMKRFWGAIAFKNGAYQGKPVAAHQQVPDLSVPLFDDWLALFSTTVDDVFPDDAARTFFKEAARRIAASLVAAFFYDPAKDDPDLRVVAASD